MFENLLKLVKEHAGDAIVKNPAIPDQHNDAAISTATSGIMDHLKSMAASGGMEKVMDMFKGGNVAGNPEVNNMSSKVAGDLMSKFGINQEQAGSIVKNLVPGVMSSLVKKTNDPNDNSFDIKGIVGSLTGGGSGVLGGIMSKVTGMFSK
jgi:uncharacterized protein YidB (DUF937 family)